jgi:hypothetical protein
MRLNAVITATATVRTAHRPAWISAGQARRLDPLAALVCAAVDRVLAGRAPLPETTAVVVGTAWGSAASTLRFLDDQARFGDAEASPTAFTTSVHHHSCGILGEALHLHGPALTVSMGGTSGLSALRQAALLVHAGRAPIALVVVADAPNAWATRTIAHLTQCPFPIGGGAVALLVERDGSGWGIDTDAPAELQVDAGGLTPAEERAYAAATERRSAAALFGAWWPTAALAAVPWDAPRTCRVRESESGLPAALTLVAP